MENDKMMKDTRDAPMVLAEVTEDGCTQVTFNGTDSQLAILMEDILSAAMAKPGLSQMLKGLEKMIL